MLVALSTLFASPVLAQSGDGFRIGDTTFKVSGFIKADVLMTDYSDGDTATSPFGRDFYLPSSIPVGQPQNQEDIDFDAHAKQTRVALTFDTPFGDRTLAGHIEGDFQTSPGPQGTQRTTNGYNFALRRAFITFNNWTFGQDWSNFMYVPALPEAADFVGPTEGTIFVRQMQVRYSRPLTDQLTLSLAVENPETGSITPTSAMLVDNDDDSMPDFTAKLLYRPPYGEFSLSAVGRQLSVDTPTESEEAFGWGLSLGGRVPFGPEKLHDVRFALTYGKGIGRYIAFNFAPDAVFVPGPQADLRRPEVLAGFAAVRYFWNEQWRSTVMLSFQDVDNPRIPLPADTNVGAWSAAVNLFYSPVKGLDLGIEYRHARREVLNDIDGKLDRVHFVAKQTF